LYIFSEPDTDSDSDSEKNAMKGSYDLLVDAELSKIKTSSKMEVVPTFPFHEEKFKFDCYGQIIKYEIVKTL